MKGPTKKQQEILLFISSFISQYGFAPSLKEMADHFHISSAAVHYALISMEKKGLVDKVGNGARSIILSSDTRKDMGNTPVPLYQGEPDSSSLENGSPYTLFVPSSLASPSTFAFRDAVLATPNLVGVFTGHEHTLMVGAERGKFLFSVPSNRDGAFLDVSLARAWGGPLNLCSDRP